MIECVVEGGWFDANGFGPRSFLGSIETNEPILVPLNEMGGPLGEFTEGPTSGMGSTPEALTRVDWFRGGVLDPTGADLPPPNGVDEFVPMGSFFVEIEDPTPRRIQIKAQSGTSNILSWNYSAGAFSWFVGASGPHLPTSAEMEIVIGGCPCDLDADGEVTSDDYFEFLVGFIAGDGDYNGDGQTNSDDFFEFIACWGSPPEECS